MKISQAFSEGFRDGFTSGAAAAIIWVILMLGWLLLISVSFSFISFQWEWAWQSRLGRLGILVGGVWFARYIWNTREDLRL